MGNENFELFNNLTKCIEDKTYSSLEAKKINNEYYLIINLPEKSVVYVNRFGKRKKYQYLWQITNWLKEKFDIQKDELIIS